MAVKPLTERTEYRYLRIRAVVAQIPVGKVASYGQVAALAGFPNNARLVSKALVSDNSTLPWHRVIRSDGKIAFSDTSSMAQRQRSRLESEGVAVTRNRVCLSRFLWQPNLYHPCDTD